MIFIQPLSVFNSNHGDSITSVKAKVALLQKQINDNNDQLERQNERQNQTSFPSQWTNLHGKQMLQMREQFGLGVNDFSNPHTMEQLARRMRRQRDQMLMYRHRNLAPKEQLVSEAPVSRLWHISNLFTVIPISLNPCFFYRAFMYAS